MDTHSSIYLNVCFSYYRQRMGYVRYHWAVMKQGIALCFCDMLKVYLKSSIKNTRLLQQVRY